MPLTEAGPNPRQLKNISVIFDNDTASAQEHRKVVQSFQFQPSQATSSVTGGTPDAVWSDLGPVTYTLAIKFLQDSESLGSLTDYLLSHAGTEHQVNFVPYGGTGWQARIIVPAPPLGGDMNTWLTDTVTCAVRGKPTRTTDDPLTPNQ